MTLSSVLSGQRIDAVLDSIAENSLCSVMVTKVESKTPIVYVNDAFTSLTGYAAEEVLGESPSLLQGAKTDQA
ncbi:MAG: PAS domain S-box protein, partial [Candidatus Binatia bacterium]